MGIGYWLTEKLIFDKNSGQLLTHNTWVGAHMVVALMIENFVLPLFNCILLNFSSYLLPIEAILILGVLEL